MARKNRDAIFEQVVLKEGAKSEVLLCETRGGANETSHGSTKHHFRMARQGSETSTSYDPTSIPEQQEGVDSNELKKEEERSFDNATYMYYPDNSTENKRKGGTELLSTSGKVIVIIILIVAISIVLFLVLVGVGLASANNSEVTKLGHTTVDEATYQLEVSLLREMLSSMKIQMSALNNSVMKLNDQLEKITQHLNAVNTTLDQQVVSIQGRIDNQGNMLTEFQNQLSAGLKNASERISTLNGNQNTFNFILDTLASNASTRSENLQSEINVLRLNLNSSVDVYRDCVTNTNTNTMSFLSNDTQVQYYTLTTEPVDISEMEASLVLGIRCQITENTAMYFIQTSYLEVEPNGDVGCICTALPPPLNTNGTIEEEFDDVTITCQMVYTTCSRMQQLYTLV